MLLARTARETELAAAVESDRAPVRCANTLEVTPHRPRMSQDETGCTTLLRDTIVSRGFDGQGGGCGGASRRARHGRSSGSGRANGRRVGVPVARSSLARTTRRRWLASRWKNSRLTCQSGNAWARTSTPRAWTLLLVAYRVQILSGEPVLTDHDEIRWLRADELHTLDWAPADLPFVEALAARGLPVLDALGVAASSPFRAFRSRSYS